MHFNQTPNGGNTGGTQNPPPPPPSNSSRPGGRGEDGGPGTHTVAGIL